MKKAVWLAMLPVHAETRELKVFVERNADGTVAASIRSDVASDRRSKTSTADATEVLKHAVGWHSQVLVILETGTAQPSDYQPLLDAIAANLWLRLSRAENRNEKSP